jgi:acetyl-CoA carboxylase biotin carboxyl carrier protein
MKFDIKTLEILTKSLEENDITEFSYEEKGTKIKIKRGQEVIEQQVMMTQVQAPMQQISTPKATANVESAKTVNLDLPAIVSPMVGTFYSSNQPGAPAFVKEGDIITEGQVLCIVEAMKLMNEVKSDKSGKVVKVLVKNGEPVKKGDKLFLVE